MLEEQMSVGAQLRAAREAQGLTIEQAVQQLKLARRQIEAIESDDFAALPGNTFARGFVRNYARLLKLDAEPFLAALESQLPREREQVAFPQASENPSNLGLEIREGAARTGTWPVVLMVALGLLIGGGLVWWYLQQPAMPEIAVEERESAASLPEVIPYEDETLQASAPDIDLAIASMVSSAPASAVQESASVAQASAVSVAVASREAALPASTPVRRVSSAVAARGIRVVAGSDTWVQIHDAEGQRIFSGILNAGAEQAWAGQPPYQLKIGNAPSAKLFYRGKLVDLAPFTRGDVATLELK